MNTVGRAVGGLATWIGGWSRLALLMLVIAAVIAGLVWERQRHPLTPPGALDVRTSLMTGMRQTSFRYAESVDEARSFYRQTLGGSGWNYCGTQATENCTNMVNPSDGSGAEVDVYRRVDDTTFAGTTIEVWPQSTGNGETYVTVWETQAP